MRTFTNLSQATITITLITQFPLIAGSAVAARAVPVAEGGAAVGSGGAPVPRGAEAAAFAVGEAAVRVPGVAALVAAGLAARDETALAAAVAVSAPCAPPADGARVPVAFAASGVPVVWSARGAAAELCRPLPAVSRAVPVPRVAAARVSVARPVVLAALPFAPGLFARPPVAARGAVRSRAV